MPPDVLVQSTLQLPCSVVIVSSAHRNERGLATATAMFVSQVPPLVAISLSSSSSTRALIEQSGEFAINVIAQNQLSLAKKVGSLHGLGEDKMTEFDIASAPAAKIGSPLIAGCFAHYECKVKRSLEVGSGKQSVFIAEVVEARIDPGLRPLVWWKNEYFEVGPACQV